MRNYFLVFQPMHADYQYSVRFNEDGTTDVVKINKFSDVVYGSKNDKKIKKNTFGEIDKVMTSLSSIDEFFEKYVDKKVFNYTGSIRDIFIGKVKNGYVNSYECVVNNPKLHAKNKFVLGSKIDAIFCDADEFKNDEKQQMVELLIDPDSNFLEFVTRVKEEKRKNYKSCVSNEILEIAKEARMVRKSIKYGTDSGVFEHADYLTEKLKNKLTSYKEYREMFLMREKYLLSLEQQKEEAIRLKEQAEQVAALKAITFEPFKPYSSEQMSIFEQEGLSSLTNHGGSKK